MQDSGGGVGHKTRLWAEEHAVSYFRGDTGEQRKEGRAMLCSQNVSPWNPLTTFVPDWAGNPQNPRI